MSDPVFPANGRSESELRAHARQQAAVAALGQRALTNLPLPDLMTEASDLVRLVLDVDYSGVLELLPKDDQLLVRAGAGWKDGVVGQATLDARDGSQAARTLASRKPVIAPGPGTNGRFPPAPLLRRHRAVAGISVIIDGRERPYGVLVAFSRRRRHFAQDQVHVLQAVANVLAAAVERRRAEDALRQSEERYRELFENANDIFYTHDLAGRFTSVNAAAERVTGYSREEALAMNISQVIAPEHQERAREMTLRKLREGSATVYEIDIIARDGRRLPVEVSTSIVYESGRPVSVQGIARDVGERRRLEEALEQIVRGTSTLTGDDFFQTLVRHLASVLDVRNAIVGELIGHDRVRALAVWDGDGPGENVEYDLAGTPCANVVGQTMRCYPRDVARLFPDAPVLAATGAESFLGTPLFDSAGRALGILVALGERPMEQTSRAESIMSIFAARASAELERKRAEEALRESERKYRRMVESVQDLFYSTDAAGIILDITPSVARYAYTREGLIGTSVLDIYEDPEQRAQLVQAILTRGRVTDFGVRLKTGDGRVRDASVSAQALRGPNGEFLGIEGSLRDISERTQAEEALRKERDFTSAVIDTAGCLVVVLDSQGRIVRFNRACEQVTGYRFEEVAGRHVWDLFVGPDEAAGVQGIFRLLAAGSAAGGEYENYWLTRDGERRLISWTNTTLRDVGGAAEYFISSGVDITERRRMEEALREQARRDPLTGTLNHAAITDTLREMIAACNDGETIGLAMVDVDGLKAVNDVHGHLVGDGVLIAVASALARDGAIVGRYGGDEFLAILPGAAREDAERYRQAVLSTLAEAKLVDPETSTTVAVEATVGLAVYPEEAETAADLVQLSDTAMYAARRQRPVTVDGLPAIRPLAGEQAARIVGEVVPLLTSPGKLEDKLNLVSSHLSAGANYDAVNFVLLDREATPPLAANTVATVAPEIVEEWNRDQRRDDSDHAIRRLLQRTLRPIILEDPGGDERLSETQRRLLSAAGLRSAVVTPMLWQGRLVGMMAVASKQQGAFGPRDAQFLTAIATQVTAIVRMARLVEDLQSASTSLAQSHGETVLLLAAAAEAHDRTTGLHLQNIRRLTEMLALQLGYTREDAEELGLASVLHDIGKIRVPDAVLAGSGPLTDEDWDLMKQHTLWGADFLAERPGFELAAAVARYHHERWDGRGYPDGLAGDGIPRSAAIVSVADAFDAMTSDRPYRAALIRQQAVAEIQAGAGHQFSPEVARALVRLARRGRLPWRPQGEFRAA